MLKKTAKAILPPFIHEALRKLFYRDKHTYRPEWHTITAGNLKGRQLFIDPKDGLWQQEMLDGRYDRFIYDYLEKFNLRGKTVFEIGAHIGYHALHFASLVGDKGSVYAFEPNRFNRERMEIILEKNSDLAKRVRVFEVALSQREGQEDFYFCRDIDSGRSSGSFVENAHTYYPKTQQYLELFERTTVRTVSLDHIASYTGTDTIPHVIKIDVEGAEGSVLQGGIELVKQHRPLVIIEVHSILNMLIVCEILKSEQYTIVLLKEEPDGRCFISAEPHVESLP
jgi:FkbM family methyltransferase